LEKIFFTVQTQPCLNLIDAISFIPNEFTLNATKTLTDQLFQYNSDAVLQTQTVLRQTAESLKKYQQEQINQATRIIRVPSRVKVCAECHLPLSRSGPQTQFTYKDMSQQQIVFQCCHCFHLNCYLEHLLQSGGLSIRKALQKLIMLQDDLNAEREVEKVLIDVRNKATKECFLCSDQAVQEALDLL